MPFELLELTEARLAGVTNRTEERVEKPGRTARGRAATRAALDARVGEVAP